MCIPPFVSLAGLQNLLGFGSSDIFLSVPAAACLLAQLWEVSTFYRTSVLGIRDWSWSELLLELCIGVEESSIGDWHRDCGDIHKRTLSFLWTGRRIRGVRMFSGDVSPKRRVLCESS